MGISSDVSSLISESQLDLLESRLGYGFNDRDLLSRSLVHRSLINESELRATESNERLEFLGDAALGLAATNYLYQIFPDRLEGELSAARASVINLHSLGKRAESINLADFVQTGAADILANSRSCEAVIGRSYEAIIGAIFLDGGWLEVTNFLDPWFDEFFHSYDFSPKKSLNSKSQLQHFTQGNNGKLPIYRLIESIGPTHAPRFRVDVSIDGAVIAEGEGSSVQRAELDAAGRAIDILGPTNGYENDESSR